MMSLALGKFQTEGGVAQQPLLVSEKYRECPFVWPEQNALTKTVGQSPSFDRMILARTQH